MLLLLAKISKICKWLQVDKSLEKQRTVWSFFWVASIRQASPFFRLRALWVWVAFLNLVLCCDEPVIATRWKRRNMQHATCNTQHATRNMQHCQKTDCEIHEGALLTWKMFFCCGNIVAVSWVDDGTCDTTEGSLQKVPSLSDSRWCTAPTRDNHQFSFLFRLSLADWLFECAVIFRKFNPVCYSQSTVDSQFHTAHVYGRAVLNVNCRDSWQLLAHRFRATGNMGSVPSDVQGESL